MSAAFYFKKIMKLIVLAAGYATRLYPLTLNQPKFIRQLQIGKSRIKKSNGDGSADARPRREKSRTARD